jgi:hypothetical protein
MQLGFVLPVVDPMHQPPSHVPVAQGQGASHCPVVSQDWTAEVSEH